MKKATKQQTTCMYIVSQQSHGSGRPRPSHVLKPSANAKETDIYLHKKDALLNTEKHARKNKRCAAAQSFSTYLFTTFPFIVLQSNHFRRRSGRPRLSQFVTPPANAKKQKQRYRQRGTHSSKNRRKHSSRFSCLGGVKGQSVKITHSITCVAPE